MRIRMMKMPRAVRTLAMAIALTTTGFVAGCSRPQPGDPLPGLERSERVRFDRGKEVFEREFTPETGLGPLFNSTSCGECHEEPATGGFGDEVEVHATAFLVRGSGSGAGGAAAGEEICDPLIDQGG